MLQVNHTAGQTFDLAEVVAGKHQRDLGRLRGHVDNHVFHLALGMRVQAGGGLVQQEQLRRQRPGPRQCHPLHLTARQLARIALRQLGQAHPGKRRARQHQRLAPGPSGQPQAKRHIGLHRQPQQMRPLKKHGLAQVLRPHQPPGRRRCQAVQQPQQRAFAAAVGAHQRHAFTCTNDQIQFS